MELGLPVPMDLCPAGFYCEEGTSTIDPSDSVAIKPLPCQAGVFCLGGVSSPLPVEWIPTQPWGAMHSQFCQEGTYCLEAAYKLSGSGLCFPGHYCPPDSSYPVISPVGSFSANEGAIAPALCFPGTYAPLRGQVDCLPCPSGHTCPSYGTYVPSICPAGTFRSQVDSVPCRLCQAGTYSVEVGAPDISYCLPCPQGRVCRQQGLSDLALSTSCAAGYICAYGTERSRQFAHNTPAGYYSASGSTSTDQYNNPCSPGFFCVRGTADYLANKTKCTIGYYCPQGSPAGSAISNQCPRLTNSLIGSSTLENCQIVPVSVCDKQPINPRFPMQDLTYYPTFSYQQLDDVTKIQSFDSSPTSSGGGDGEVVTVIKINPVNVSSSASPWVNETIEAFRLCPSYGSSTGSNAVIIIGRNFRNSSLNYCKWRACLSANLNIYPRRCRNQINQGTSPLPRAGDVSATTYLSVARYLSPTRMECTIPEFFFNDPNLEVAEFGTDEFFLTSRYKCLFISPLGKLVSNQTDGELAYARVCDGTPCLNQPYTGWEYFTSTRLLCANSELVCSNSPEQGWMFNPCITGEALVEVTNDGEHYSGGVDLAGFSILSTVRETEAGAIVFKKFKNFTSISTFAVYTYIMSDKFFANAEADEMLQLSCLSSQYVEEAPRERETGWFSLEMHQAAHVLIDLSHIPDTVVYGQHYRIALFMQASRCAATLCDSHGARLQDSENVPCALPSDISQWFDDASVPKNIANNITVYALEDILFKVEIQILHSFFAPYAPLFKNSTSIQIVSPSRAYVTAGLPEDDLRLRQLSPYTSRQEALTLMKYIFTTIVHVTDSSIISAPLNLPPQYAGFTKGRALVLFNVSSDSNVPVVIDSNQVNINDFFTLPASTSGEAKELIDAYQETFYEMQHDEVNGYQFTFTQAVLPFLPYFSNCDGFDSYIPFWMLFESKECALPETYPPDWYRYAYPALPDQDHIRYVGAWDFVGNPVTDWCYRTLQCNYEESLTNPDNTPRWFEVTGTGTPLFTMLRDPVDYYQYTGRTSTHPSSKDHGGGAAVTAALAQSEDSIISVTIDHSEGDLINGCAQLCFARSYLLEFAYYQINNHQKRIVIATLIGSEYDIDATNTKYTLNAELRPMGYIELVQNFQYEIRLYLVLTCFVGLITVAISMLTWLVARLTTQLQNPPDLKIVGMIQHLAPPALAGVTLAVIPIWILTSMGNLLINGYFFGDPL
jgi:hypothetical protein